MSIRSAKGQIGRRSKGVVVPVNETKELRKARHLPMFGPGMDISIPLGLLPEYLKLYDLEVLGPKQIGWLREHGIRKKDGVLYVRRVPQAKESKHEESSAHV